MDQTNESVDWQLVVIDAQEGDQAKHESSNESLSAASANQCVNTQNSKEDNYETSEGITTVPSFLSVSSDVSGHQYVNTHNSHEDSHKTLVPQEEGYNTCEDSKSDPSLFPELSDVNECNVPYINIVPEGSAESAGHDRDSTEVEGSVKCEEIQAVPSGSAECQHTPKGENMEHLESDGHVKVPDGSAESEGCIKHEETQAVPDGSGEYQHTPMGEHVESEGNAMSEESEVEFVHVIQEDVQSLDEASSPFVVDIKGYGSVLISTDGHSDQTLYAPEIVSRGNFQMKDEDYVDNMNKPRDKTSERTGEVQGLLIQTGLRTDDHSIINRTACEPQIDSHSNFHVTDDGEMKRLLVQTGNKGVSIILFF